VPTIPGRIPRAASHAACQWQSSPFDRRVVPGAKPCSRIPGNAGRCGMRRTDGPPRSTQSISHPLRVVPDAPPRQRRFHVRNKRHQSKLKYAAAKPRKFISTVRPPRKPRGRDERETPKSPTPGGGGQGRLSLDCRTVMQSMPWSQKVIWKFVEETGESAVRVPTMTGEVRLPIHQRKRSPGQNCLPKKRTRRSLLP